MQEGVGLIAHGCCEATRLNATAAKSVPASLETHHAKCSYHQVTTENKGILHKVKVCRAGASMPEQARGDGGASKMQASINPSSIQQQFAFAAGLATADDLPIATPSEIVQLSQVSSSTESKLPPTQQDTESDQQSNTQSASPSNLRPQQPMGRNQQEGQLNPGDDPNQLTDVSQQPGDRAQPEQRGKSEAQLVSGPSPSGSSVAGSSVAGSSASGGSGSGNGSSSSSSDSAVGEGSSADAEVVEVEQMSFGERLQAGLDCFR